MNCQHINKRNPTQATHTLPCRDKLCMDCLLQISDLFKGNVFSCPLCGNYAQYVDAMIESILDDANAHRTKQIGQTKEEISPNRTGEVAKRNQRSDEASEKSDWYGKLKQGDPPRACDSNKNFSSSYSADGYSSYNQYQSPSILHSQQHYPHQLRDDHSGFKVPNHPLATGTEAYHQKEYPDHHSSATIQETLAARCQQNKANSERNFQVDNRRNIPLNYCHSDQAQASSKADIFCSEHKQSEVYFFCQTCDVPVCAKCVDTSHYRHDCEKLDTSGETAVENQSKFYHDGNSDISAEEPHFTTKRNSSTNRQDWYQSSKDEDFPVMNEADRQKQKEMLERYQQTKHHHLAHYNSHVLSQSPHRHEYNLRSRSTGRDRCGEVQVAQVNPSESKRGDRFCKDHPGSEVYFFCKTCDKVVCGKCIAGKHEAHTFHNFDNSEDKTTYEVMCVIHNLPCTMYCVKCNEMICTNCSKEIRHHWHHETWSLNKDTIIDNFMNYLKTLKKNTEECDKLNKSVAEGKEKIQKQADEMKQKIMKETQAAKDKIDSIAAEQIAKVEDELERCMKPRNDLNAKIATMEKELKDSKDTITTAWELLADNDLLNAALAARSVDKSLQQFTKTEISQPSERFELHCQVNVIQCTMGKAPFYVYRPTRSSYYYGSYSTIHM